MSVFSFLNDAKNHGRDQFPMVRSLLFTSELMVLWIAHCLSVVLLFCFVLNDLCRKVLGEGTSGSNLKSFIYVAMLSFNSNCYINLNSVQFIYRSLTQIISTIYLISETRHYSIAFSVFIWLFMTWIYFILARLQLYLDSMLGFPLISWKSQLQVL
jgi:hypothetical protein